MSYHRPFAPIPPCNVPPSHIPPLWHPLSSASIKKTADPVRPPSLESGRPDPFPLPKDTLETQGINVRTWNLNTKIRQRSSPAEFCPGLSTPAGLRTGGPPLGDRHRCGPMLRAPVGSSWKLSDETQVKEWGEGTFLDGSESKPSSNTSHLSRGVLLKMWSPNQQYQHGLTPPRPSESETRVEPSQEF